MNERAPFDGAAGRIVIFRAGFRTFFVPRGNQPPNQSPREMMDRKYFIGRRSRAALHPGPEPGRVS